MERVQPKKRFKEFSSNWNTKKLGQISKFAKGKGISKADIVEDGEFDCIRYGELYTHYQETINNTISKTNGKKEDLTLSEENDIIIPASGETQLDIAKASCVVRSGIALGGDLNIIRTKENGVFLSYYLNSKRKLDIARLSQGISVVHLYSSQLATLNLNLPTLPEQQKIATFLTTVDEKINLLKIQKSELELYKKGVMQKIFSQELRFKDEEGNEFPKWEIAKLKEVAKKKSSNIAANTIEENIGEFIVYGASGELKRIDFYQEEDDYISIVKDGAGVGRLFYCKGKSSVLGTLEKISPIAKMNTYFLFSILSNIDFTKYVTGSTIPHIYFKDYSNESIKFPCIEEQTKIANFLSALDEKIALNGEQITKMEVWKKGLLQGMFV